MRDPRQQMQALQRANSTRQAKRAIRIEVESLPWPDAIDRVEELLLEKPKCLATTRVGDVVGWVYGWGDTRTTRLTLGTNVSLHKPVAALTERQARLLAARMRELGGRNRAGQGEATGS